MAEIKPSQCSNRLMVDDDRWVIFYHPEDSRMSFFVIAADSADHPDGVRWEMSGCVKWDGCSDMDIGGEEMSYRNHFCGPEDARQVGKWIDAVYELAEQNISDWDRGWMCDRPTDYPAHELVRQGFLTLISCTRPHDVEVDDSSCKGLMLLIGFVSEVGSQEENADG